MRKFVLIAVLALASVTGFAETTQISDKEVQEWATFYYKKPRPDLTPLMLKHMSEKGWLGKPAPAWSIVGILSGILEQNPSMLSAWLSDVDRRSIFEQKNLYQAVWLSNTPSSQEFLKKIGPDHLIKLYGADISSTKPPRIVEIPINQPGIIDMLWGRFFATGEPENVRRIISVLYLQNLKPRTPDGKINAGPFLIGGAADWSLRANAIQHEKVLEICKQELLKQSGENKEILAAAIKLVEEKRAVK